MNKDFSGALSAISKILFTNRCRLCGEVIELNRELCESCENPPEIQSPRCEYCGASKPDCKCKKHKNEYKAIVAPFYYTDSIVTAVNRCKSSDMPFLAKAFADEMSEVVNSEFSEIQFDYITFIPMTKLALMKRGFNQSELIAKAMSDNLNIECRSLLAKVERTKPQKEQSARERKVNLFGAFDVTDKQAVKDKTILLVDDVKTTGSTLNECSKMLKIYGAKAVYCATFAIVNNKKD